MVLIRKPPKILIIDDDPSLCRIFERFLTANGYAVRGLYESKEGLFLTRSQFFNVVILDICLPEENGLSLLSKIRNISSDTEIIMITGNWDTETAIQSFQLGAYDYLKKPIELGHLLQIVKRALEKQALEYEKKYLIAEINFKNMLLEKQKDLLEHKVIENDQRIRRLIRRGLYSEKLFEKMAESLPLGVIVIGREGQFLICNEVQETFSGVSRGSLSGKNFFHDPLPSGLKPWEELLRKVSISKSYEIKVVDQRPEKERILSITLSSLTDDRGNSTGFIFLTADITVEKKREEQIIQTEKMSAIGQLAADLAHQIRNPLGIVGSAAQFCIEKTQGKGGLNGLEKHFEIIYRNVQNANKIISDLLGFARPKLLEFKVNDVNQILEEVFSLIKTDFNKNRIRLLKRMNRDLPAIICDRESMKQVFLNLLMNSRQAMPRGGVISVSTGYHVEDQFVEIVIEDTGQGIHKEHLSNIFNPYFTTKEKGTGLGLSIAHRIIAEHEGRIFPESKEGKGTRMTVTLPVKSLDSETRRGENEQNSYR